LNTDKNVIGAKQFGRNLKAGFSLQNLEGAEDLELENLGGFPSNKQLARNWRKVHNSLQNLEGAED
jgi:hypothetical protein